MRARVRSDDERRTTLPPALLGAAGVGAGTDLVVRVEGPGRIVLESPAGGLVALDASFVLALLKGEEHAQRFTDDLARRHLSAGNAGEVYATLAERTGLDPAEAQETLLALGVNLADLPVAVAAHPRGPVLPRLRPPRRRPGPTGDRHWTTLVPLGLDLDVHDFRDPATTL